MSDGRREKCTGKIALTASPQLNRYRWWKRDTSKICHIQTTFCRRNSPRQIGTMTTVWKKLKTNVVTFLFVQIQRVREAKDGSSGGFFSLILLHCFHYLKLLNNCNLYRVFITIFPQS
jgi:hypothetical protein